MHTDYYVHVNKTSTCTCTCIQHTSIARSYSKISNSKIQAMWINL